MYLAAILGSSVSVKSERSQQLQDHVLWVTMDPVLDPVLDSVLDSVLVETSWVCVDIQVIETWHVKVKVLITQ